MAPLPRDRPRGPPRRPRATQGARSNDKEPRRRGGRWRRLGPWRPEQRRDDEPADHGIGRSRGGLTTKTHLLVDGRGRPLVIAVTPGQAGDSTQLTRLLGELRVERLRGGRARTTPTALRGDKAYSARAHRALLRRRGITAVIPEPDDQKRNRARRGSRGGRPVGFDARDYKGRNVVERCFNQLKNWRGLATRYDKHALVFRGGVVLAAILLWLRPT